MPRKRFTFRENVARYFYLNPGRWIDSTVLALIGGGNAWRTRVSEVRRGGMTIENRLRRPIGSDGFPYTISEYRYVGDANG